MLFLIPLGLSLLSAGMGIANQVAENDQAARAGAEAVAAQEVKNRAARVDQHSEYIRSLDAIQEENKSLMIQATLKKKQNQSGLTLALYLTAGLMALLTIITAASKLTPKTNQ